MRKETRCCHIAYSFRLAARFLLCAPSHGQDSTYHGLCYTSRGALAGTRNSSMGSPHEGSIRRPIAPWSVISLPLRRDLIEQCRSTVALTTRKHCLLLQTFMLIRKTITQTNYIKKKKKNLFSFFLIF